MEFNDYAINPHTQMRIITTWPVRDQGLLMSKILIDDELGLARFLKDLIYSGLLHSFLQIVENPHDLSQIQIPPAHFKYFVDMGLLIERKYLPRPVPYHLDLLADLPLLPTSLDPSEELPSNLDLAENCFIQWGDKLPSEMNPLSLPFWQRLSPARPLIWVRDPLTQMFWPYWATPELLQSITRPVDPVPFSPLICQRLLQAGVWVSTQEKQAKQTQITQAIHRLSQTLAQEQYVVLRQVLPPLVIGYLRGYVRKLEQEGYFRAGDNQVETRKVIHNQPFMRFLHYQILHYISQLLSTPIKPSYSYLALYQPGSILPHHVDRSQCLWNISLMLDSEPEQQGEAVWPIYLRPKNEAIPIHLDYGDALLYPGTEIEHWRSVLPADQTCTVVLFHFVAADFEGDLD